MRSRTATQPHSPVATNTGEENDGLDVYSNSPTSH